MPDSRADISRLAFSVDTHLFRELGKLLVGRDSTALIELVKNAYDADATRVVLHAENLDGSDGVIRIADNGTGMSFGDFESRFLRIAGRSKEGEQRRSAVYGRRFTGAKGIGRLSAFKLAEVLDVVSIPASSQAAGVEATVDWTELEEATGDVQDTELVRARRLAPASEGRNSGTTLALRRLRLASGAARRDRFLREVRGTRPDPTLHEPLPKRVLDVPLLLPRIQLSDTLRDAPFEIELSGDLDPGDQPWPTLLSAMQWIIEIDAREHTVIYRVSPTPLQRALQPASEARQFKYERPAAGSGPRFAARILVRAPQQTEKDSRLPDLLDRFAKEVSGIRLYMEGFQVLPYGTAGNDWLQIDADRARRSPLRFEDADLPSTSNVDQRTYQLNNRNYIGAVFLQENTSGGLEMVVNREGFLPGSTMDELVDLVRRGVDLSVRVRAALGAANREQAEERRRQQSKELLEEWQRNQAVEESGARVPDSAPKPPSREDQLHALVGAAREAVKDLRANAASVRPEAVTLVRAALDETQASLEAARDEQSQLRVLASVGTQFGAFIHEVNGLLGQARIVLQMLDDLLAEGDLPRAARGRLGRVRRACLELVASLERQAIYLTDTIGAEARRRRSRQVLAARYETAMRLLGLAAERRGVEVRSSIPQDLKTPPMFPAEVNVILTNLISNAIKAAGESGRVVLSGSRGDREVVLRVDNTGVAVDLDDAERWFRPFETTTAGIDDALGQGMGLGLPLTRRIVEEYGGDIRFVEPSSGFASAVEVRFPQGLR